MEYQTKSMHNCTITRIQFAKDNECKNSDMSLVMKQHYVLCKHLYTRL
uniref:Uncharacterized protein n=1 Tax=Arundo donax TaxID=35708 RepID=A0A0A8Z099_ARUDO